MNEYEEGMEQPKDLWHVNNPSGTSGFLAVDKVGGAALFLHPETLEVLTSITIPGAHEMAISPDHKLGYIAQFGKWGKNALGKAALLESASLIWVLDLELRKVVQRIDTFPNIGPHGMKFDAEGRLWVTFESNALGVVDTRSHKLVGSWDLGEPAQPPRTLEINSDGSTLYCSGKGDDILVFDISSRSVKKRIEVKGGVTSLTLSPDGTRLISFDKDKQNMLVIDTASNEISERHPYKGAVLGNPNASRFIHAHFSHDGRYLATCNYAGGTAHLHDGENPEKHNVIPVAKGPQGIAFSDDCKTLYVANHDCGTVTIIDVESGVPTEWLACGKGIEAFRFF